jgi:hypothetical protein
VLPIQVWLSILADVTVAVTARVVFVCGALDVKNRGKRLFEGPTRPLILHDSHRCLCLYCAIFRLYGFRHYTLHLYQLVRNSAPRSAIPHCAGAHACTCD